VITVWQLVLFAVATGVVRAVEMPADGALMPNTISRRLGHSSAAFTMDRYGHLLPGMQTKAAAALDHLLS
ncbi:MAG: hypothetical protein VYB24_07890, partial [Pseudomonadota bacterium]|nr:hypothetical protein [Pseudomonadota bacterium]